MPAYLALETLKARLILAADPGVLDADLARLIAVASQMVADRARPIPADVPPVVEQATLMLAMRMRLNETGGYLNADGTRSLLPLWTQDLTDILGRDWARDAPPATPPAGPGFASGTTRLRRAHAGPRGEYRRPGPPWPWGEYP